MRAATRRKPNWSKYDDAKSEVRNHLEALVNNANSLENIIQSMDPRKNSKSYNELVRAYHSLCSGMDTLNTQLYRHEGYRLPKTWGYI